MAPKQTDEFHTDAVRVALNGELGQDHIFSGFCFVSDDYFDWINPWRLESRVLRRNEGQVCPDVVEKVGL